MAMRIMHSKIFSDYSPSCYFGLNANIPLFYSHTHTFVCMYVRMYRQTAKRGSFSHAKQRLDTYICMYLYGSKIMWAWYWSCCTVMAFRPSVRALVRTFLRALIVRRNVVQVLILFKLSHINLICMNGFFSP